ncbi:MAG: hypothetical protein K0M45_06825 [Candidatus Paracaedibacteraceae bacterium]|nr:hypothetical protein [Candidatus Paracaedibacteraceae bacterium]
MEENKVKAPLSLTNSQEALQLRRNQLDILGQADSRQRVILQSWEVYKTYNPSFNFDPELDISILEYFIDFWALRVPLLRVG